MHQPQVTDALEAILQVNELPVEDNTGTTLSLNILVSPEHRESVKTLAASVRGLFDQVACMVDAGDGATMIAIREAFSDVKKLKIIEREGVGDDLGGARNEIFEATDCTWRMFLDGDETLPNALKIKSVLAHVNRRYPNVNCIWMHGRYADIVDECRPRILRWKDGWRWIGRAHEEPVIPGRTRTGAVVTDLATIHHIDIEAREQGRHPGPGRVARAFELALKEGKLTEAGGLGYHLGIDNLAQASRRPPGSAERLKLEEMSARQLSLCAEAIPGTSTAAHALTALARLTLAQGRLVEAAEIAGRAVGTTPSLLDGHLALGLAKLSQGNEAAAALAFEVAEQVADSTGKTDAVIRGRLDINFEAYGWSGAVIAYIGAGRDMAQVHRAYRRIPDRAHAIGQVETARTALGKAEALNALTTLTTHLLASGEPAKALAVLERCAPATLEDEPILNQAIRAIKIRLGRWTKEQSDSLAGAGNRARAVQILHQTREEMDDDEQLTIDAPIPVAKPVNSPPPEVFEQARLWGPTALWSMFREAGLDGRLEARNDGKLHATLRKAKIPSEDRRVTFWINDTPESFDPDTHKTRHLMGSEEAVLELVTELAHRGWEVTVFAPRPSRQDGAVVHGHNGVLWRPSHNFDPFMNYGTLVMWRIPQALNLPEIAQNPSRKVLMLQDHMYKVPKGTYERADAIVVRSQTHIRQLSTLCTLDPNAPNIVVAPDGLDEIELFPELTETGEADRIKTRMIYCSSPDRGLEQLIDIWPQIRAAVPEATLEISYSWTSFVRNEPARADALRAKITALEASGVKLLGGLTAPDMARLMRTSGVWAMPCTWPEVSCMAAAKSMAAGCEPVATDKLNMGLTETLIACGDGPIADPKNFTESLIWALKSPEPFGERKKRSDMARARYGWRCAAAPAFEKAILRPV